METSALLAKRTSTDVGKGLKDILRLANATDVISFAGGFPEPATFPGATLVELLDHVVGDASAMQYSPTPGIDSVRGYLRSRLETLEGVRPGEGELMVTSGAVEAVELVCKRFLDPHDTVAVEAPTYLGAIMAFRGHEADIRAVDTDEDGLRVDVLTDHLHRGMRPKLLYTIPDYQNPRGVSLSEERRNALVELADRYGFLIVEDVAYRELHFEDPPPRSLWARAPSLVVQVGTFSKTGLLDQRLIASRQLYRRRRDRLIAALERCMPDWIRWAVPHGGFFVWLEAEGDIDSVALARRARAGGVAFVPGVPSFSDGRGRLGDLLGGRKETA